MQPRDRGRVRAHRRDHRPSRPRHSVPALRATDTQLREHRDARAPRSTDGDVQLEKGPNIVVAAGVRAAAGSCRGPGAARGSATTSRPTRSCRPGPACSRTAATSRRSADFAFDVDRRDLPRSGSCARRVATSWSAATNYGQGSSREHAAIVPRYLGLRAVLGEELRPHPRAEPRELRRPPADVHRSRRLRPHRPGRRPRDRRAGRAATPRRTRRGRERDQGRDVPHAPPPYAPPSRDRGAAAASSA